MKQLLALTGLLLLTACGSMSKYVPQSQQEETPKEWLIVYIEGDTQNRCQREDRLSGVIVSDKRFVANSICHYSSEIYKLNQQLKKEIEVKKENYFMIVHTLTTYRKCAEFIPHKHNHLKSKIVKFYTKSECGRQARSYNRLARKNLKTFYITIENGGEYKEFKIKTIRAHKSNSVCKISKYLTNNQQKYSFLNIRVRPTCYLDNTSLWIFIDKRNTSDILSYRVGTDIEQLRKIHTRDGSHEVLDF